MSGTGSEGLGGAVAADRVGEGTRAHLELPVDAEAKALIPDGVSAVLHGACLQPVAAGRGQPQGHIAVRGGHCRKEARAPMTAKSPSQPGPHGPCPSIAGSPGDPETRGTGPGWRQEEQRQSPDCDFPPVLPRHPLQDTPAHPALLPSLPTAPAHL